MNKFIVLLVLLMATNLSGFAHDSETCCEKKTDRKISVSGSALVSAVPDLATISFNIKTEDVEVKKAREDNAKVAADSLNAIRKLGIPESNINMLNLNIREQNEWDPKARKSVFKGYLAQRTFKVQVKKSELDEKITLSEKVAQIVTAIVESGTNQLDSVQYGLVNDDELTNSALSKAIANAREKALLMLAPLGAELGPVLSVNESSSRPSPFIRTAKLAYAMDSAESSAMPEPDSFSEGNIEVSSSVNLVFEIQ